LGQSIDRRSPKTDRRLYGRESYQKAHNAELGFDVHSCAAVASANAQLSNPIRAKIPFDFNVGDKKLPAGEYTFSRLSGLSDNKVMSVSSRDASANVFQSTFAASVLTAKKESTLVFHKYGDHTSLNRFGQVVNKKARNCPSLAASELPGGN